MSQFFHITPFAISGLLILLVNFPLFLMLFLKGKSKSARLFSYHIFTVLIWGIGSFFIGGLQNETLAKYILKFTLIGVIFIPASFYHAASIIMNKKDNLTILFVYIQAFCFLIININDQLYASSKYIFNSFYYYNSNTTMVVFMIFWIIIVLTAYIRLILHYKICYPEQKKALLFLILSLIGFSGGITNFMATFDLNIYPYSNFLVPIHSIFITLAIFRHQLIEVDLVIKRGLVYSTVIAILSLTYLLMVLLLEKYFEELFGYKSLIVSAITAFILGLFFIPLRNKIHSFVDEYFYKGTPEEIIQQNQKLREEITRSEKYKTLGFLTSGIAHEIKNPLTAIKTFAEYLPQKIEDKEFLLKFSKLINKEVSRIDDLVHQLLDYGKPSPLSIKSADIHKLLNETIDFLNSKTIQKNITLIKQFHANEDQIISIDSNQIKQALLNLLLNALESMKQNDQLIIATEQTDKLFKIIIKDSGCGITKEDLPHVFDPFFSRKDNSTGLGLAITQSIIEKHQGKIRIRSEINVGTEITIELPVG